jgi:hypothetical protein
MRVSTSDAREGIAPSNVSKEVHIQIRWHRQDSLKPTRVFKSMCMYTKSVKNAVRTPYQKAKPIDWTIPS